MIIPLRSETIHIMVQSRVNRGSTLIKRCWVRVLYYGVRSSLSWHCMFGSGLISHYLLSTSLSHPSAFANAATVRALRHGSKSNYNFYAIRRDPARTRPLIRSYRPAARLACELNSLNIDTGLMIACELSKVNLIRYFAAKVNYVERSTWTTLDGVDRRMPVECQSSSADVAVALWARASRPQAPDDYALMYVGAVHRLPQEHQAKSGSETLGLLGTHVRTTQGLPHIYHA